MLPQAFQINDPFPLVLKKHEPPKAGAAPAPSGPKHDLTCMADSDIRGLYSKFFVSGPNPLWVYQGGSVQ